jgi:glucose-1-phosphate adenylyltransferase
VSAHLHHDYWADVGTVESFYEANVRLTAPNARFRFYHPRRPIYTHSRFLPPARLLDSTVHNSLVAEGTYLSRCSVADSVVGIRTIVSEGAQIRRSVLLGADFYEQEEEMPASDGQPPLGIGAGVELDRVIVDKKARIGEGARLVNERGTPHADGDGYYIRGGIVIVPKGGTIPPGTVV